MAFKQDDDFLRFITMGAAGSAAVSHHLRQMHGHRTIELERYAMANKIWATKIKRLRMADLVCLDCGTRVEARAKSDLAVRMSHSNTEGRQWDSGQRDEDLCAFVPWADGSPSGDPAYFTVGAMRDSAEYAKFGPPKAASEGAERDMTWPARVATRDSVVEDVDLQDAKVRLKPHVGNRRTVTLPADVPTYIYVDEGEELLGGVSFIMGCLDIPVAVDCPGSTWNYIADLDAEDDVDRYAAVKAAGIRGGTGVEQLLVDIAEDDNEDERIRLEAWASLARLDPPTYTRMVIARAEERTAGDKQSVAMAMEAVFILSELRSVEAGDALADLADDQGLDSEARCASVWGLGVAGLNDPARVLRYIADDDEDVALHALAGIGDVPDALLPKAVALLSGTDAEAASASALLAMQGDSGIDCLLTAAAADGQSSVWATVALGGLAEADVGRVANGQLSADVERALAPMWTQSRSWLRRQQLDTPLQFMQKQTIRHLA